MSTEDIKALQSTMEKMGLLKKGEYPEGKMTSELRDIFKNFRDRVDSYNQANDGGPNSNKNDDRATSQQLLAQMNNVSLADPKEMNSLLEETLKTDAGKFVRADMKADEDNAQAKYAGAQKTKAKAIANGKEDDGVIRLRNEDGVRVIVSEEILDEAKKAIGTKTAGDIKLSDGQTYNYTVGNGKSGEKGLGG